MALSIEIDIRLTEGAGCIIEAKDQQHGERVSELAAELCAALLLERRERYRDPIARTFRGIA